ncbi:MAG: 3,4-dihydroxy-2-butanone-4-phosphate synthase, partial [Bacteroidetes bacterium]|nr:3,4-dihydroxy-2-butanone-4-phosphate synthase [Bacteroidota bacterium]
MFCTVDEAIVDIKNGKLIIVVDDEDRENEGDFICAAEYVTPDIINFMITNGRGHVCVSVRGKRLDELGFQMMVDKNNALHGTPFTVSV